MKKLSSETGIRIGSIELILHDHLHMKKDSARWLPRFLTSWQKKPRVESCKTLLRLKFHVIHISLTPWLLRIKHRSIILTQNEKYNDKTPSFSSPKKAKVTLSSGKVILCNLYWEGIIMTDYLEYGQTVTGNEHSGLRSGEKKAWKAVMGSSNCNTSVRDHRAQEAVQASKLPSSLFTRHSPPPPFFRLFFCSLILKIIQSSLFT